MDKIENVTPVHDFRAIYDVFEQRWPEIYRLWVSEKSLGYEVGTAKTYFQKLQAIRNYYRKVEPQILEYHKVRPLQFYCAYPIDWYKVFTPIERMAWEAIRVKGNIVLYPQYPALQYILDFANPGLKIALELDGKDYHHKERDVIRDAELKNVGWTIFRVTGSEMWRKYKDWWDVRDMDEDEQIDNLREWALNTGDGVIEAIKQRYFSDSFYDDDISAVQASFIDACRSTLKLHKS